MKVVCLIFHYETLNLTRSVIEQLVYTGVPKETIYVHDDGSNEVFDISFEHKDIVVYRHEENIGYIKSVNFMADMLIKEHLKILPQNANLEYELHNLAFWMLNTDVTGLSKELLDKLIEFMEAHPETGVVSPAVFNNPHRKMRPSGDYHKFVTHIDWVAPLVRASAWRAVGGFDENLKGYGCDIDFCCQLRRKDMSMAVLPKLRIDHIGGGTVRTLADAKGHNDTVFMNDYLCKKYGVNDVWELIRL